MRISHFFACLLMASVPFASSAHEFWIEPHQFQIAAGDPLVADIRVGENLKGPAFNYIPPRFSRFDIVMGDVTVAVDGRAGDKPALDMPVPDQGLAVVVHVTTNSRLTYTEWDKFVNFCTHKDFTQVIDRHLERGLPQDKFREIYSRHAKSLIAVGDGKGSDQEVGLVTEIVALANPYSDDLSRGMPVKVLYNGMPRSDTQVEVFARLPDGTVNVAQYRTDADGVAVLPVDSGVMYLVDAVVMRELEQTEPTDPVWESLWASLTFMVP